jgi:hypothetical protein
VIDVDSEQNDLSGEKKAIINSDKSENKEKFKLNGPVSPSY